NEKGTCPLGHISLDAPANGEHSLLNQLAAPAVELSLELSLTEPAMEQLAELNGLLLLLHRELAS
ncbi:MAG: hypothetical protein EBU30_06800, partial [Synechococcaceae bacterium WB6_3B_236]|nr:hypothetical protein [Synechococcaceae bacterium WB6_3B_236]